MPQTLTVNKAGQTITFAPIADRTYGDAAFTLTAVAGSGLQVSWSSSNTAVATVAGNIVTIVGAGITTITASQAGDANWNPAPDVPQTLTVNKADQMITFGVLLDKSFGDPDYDLFATASSGLTISYVSSNTSVATVTGNTVHIVAVGTTTITASQPGDANYNAAADVPQPLNVFTATATITLGSLAAGYNGLGHPATATTSPAGLTVLFTYNGSPVPPVSAGSYTVESAVSDAGYHGSATGTLIISKAPLTVTADDKSRHYGEVNPPLTISYSGFISGEDEIVLDTPPSASTTADGSTAPGTVPVTVSGGSDNNYTFIYIDGTLTITKADQTIVFAPIADRTYGDAACTLTAVAGSGLQVAYSSSNSAVATLTGNVVTIVGAGSTTITASQAGDANWNAAPDVQQTLTINKADQTITFAPIADRTYGDAAFTLTAVAGSGLQVAGSSSNTAVATVTGNVVTIVGAGTTTITASQAGDANWNTAPAVQQTLTVNKAAQTITFTDYPETLLATESYTLSATSSGGVTVLFESLDNNIATVSGDQLAAVAKGSVGIRAYNDGGQNYLPAETLVTVEIESTHKDVMHLFTPNNDGFNDLWELPELTTWGKCEVRVFSRSGKLVFADDNYNNTWDGTSGGKPVPEGAYYYVIKTESVGVVKGTLNIVR